MNFRPLGKDGEPWPSWIQALKRASGAYAIKQGGRVVYVGSSGGRLYDTITRHFQQWHRNKTWWKGAYGKGHDPGMTYPRARCEIAVALAPAGTHRISEAQLIERLRPRDNLVEHPDGSEDAPF